MCAMGYAWHRECQIRRGTYAAVPNDEDGGNRPNENEAMVNLGRTVPNDEAAGVFAVDHQMDVSWEPTALDTYGRVNLGRTVPNDASASVAETQMDAAWTLALTAPETYC